MNPDKDRETVRLDETAATESGPEPAASPLASLETPPPSRRGRMGAFFGEAFRALSRLFRLKPKSPAEEGMTASLALAVGQGSHRGSRDQNEDRLGWFSTVYGELFIVADGMGGHSGGQEAAETVLETFREHFEGGGSSGPPPRRITSLIRSRARSGRPLPADASSPSCPGGQEPDPEDLLLQALLAADRQVYLRGKTEPSLAGLGSTVAVLLMRGGEVWYSHVGDSRIYLFRQGRLEQLTRDHSVVQEMIEAGRLSPREAADHPDSHLLTQSLGGHLDPGRISVCCTSCLAGDIFLLCSDGLTGPVSSEDISRVLKKSWPVQRQVNKLMDMALSAGGSDNVTLQLMRLG